MIRRVLSDLWSRLRYRFSPRYRRYCQVIIAREWRLFIRQQVQMRRWHYEKLERRTAEHFENLYGRSIHD